MTSSIAILGAGPAGLTAAIYAARAGCAVAVLEGFTGGGQLSQTPAIENFPGFPGGIGGAELVARMRRQAEECGAQFLQDEATLISQDFQNPGQNEQNQNGSHSVDSIQDSVNPVKFAIATMLGETVEARAVIVATGATAKWLGVPGEAKFRGHGVSSCATCDGALFKGKDVAVIGGGDTALTEALYLAQICRKVTLIHRRDTFRAAKALADRVAATPNIEPLMGRTVAEFVGEGRKLTALRLDEGVLEVSGAFVAVGHEPQTAFLKDFLELEEDGTIKPAGEVPFTSVPGVFAAGDCADRVYRQAITAAAAGAKAGIEAARYASK